MIHIVGAGPGAPDLITLRGKNYLEQADVIIYAGSLVNPALLDYAKEGCQVYNSATMTLDEVVDVVAAAEKEGKMTVRLHTGDPSIYGAIREQMDRFAELGFSYDVTPGVSSAFGTAAALQCEYTLPNVSQSVIFTRMEGRTPMPEGESIESFAAHHATMVVFLSAGMLDKLSEQLVAGGYEPDTPVAVVYKATWPDEKIVRGTLADIAGKAAEAGITKTALTVVGWCLGDDYELSRLYASDFSTEFRKASHS
jgi:precorrin-4/cobalt-precorrin-4 C11-methyltransferase